MTRVLSFFALIFCFFAVDAQKDSISLSVRVVGERQLEVKQRIIYNNPIENSISAIKLLNWSSAYYDRNTPLAKRKLEERNIEMYFAEKQRFGEVTDLKILLEGKEVSNVDVTQENIYLPLPTPLEKGEKKVINLTYKINLPDAGFTGYGRAKEGFLLKYFFIVPDSFEDERQQPKYYLNIEENQNIGSFWDINFEVSEDYFVQSNIPEGNHKFHFRGETNTDLEIYLSKNEYKTLNFDVEGKKVEVILAYPVENNDLRSVEFYLPLHLKFIKERIGFLPSKIFISSKEKNKNKFLGSEDIKLGSRRLPVFTGAEKVDLDYFNVISQNVLEDAFRADKNTDHWLKNGLKTYLEIQYLKKFYKEHPILGSFRDLSFWGIKLLKWSNASKLKLIDRYGVAYQYARSQNIDQPIGTYFDRLSNYNQIAISEFEMGMLLDFVSEKEGKKEFENFVKFYIEEYKDERVIPIHFLDNLLERFGNQYDFLKDFIHRKQRVDFGIKSIQKLKKDEVYEVKVSKNTLQNIPFKLEVRDKFGKEQVFWLDTQEGVYETKYQLPINQPTRFVINPNYSFPEKNFRNNFFEKRSFGFYKKLKFRLFTDIPNPEFTEIYINPDLRYNAYDALLLGINFRNSGIFSEPFSYSITPYMSVGEWRLTGTARISYKIQPKYAFFRRLILGASSAYFHYNYGLSYRKTSLFSKLDFTQKQRSFIDTSLRLSYQYVDIDLPSYINRERSYGYYGLWNLGFDWKDAHPIHEKYISTNFQLMRDFQKLSVEGIYYWRFSPRKYAKFRGYGGIFLKNDAKNRIFNFGISKINDYNYSYSLLGRSSVSGLFAQEFIMAEGGFKSFVGGSADEWILAANVDVPIWKIFSVYGDIGEYKNKNFSPRFIWDSGIKMGIIPNILEIYFPVQSSLGFEPSLEKYQKRIRFSLNLDLNSIIRAVRNKK